MEIRHQTGKWRQICIPCFLFLLAVLRQCDATEEQDNFNKSVCSEVEYEHNGFCCDKCPSGFKLIEKCPGQGWRSKCERCSSETFQDKKNAFPNCFSCRSPCNRRFKETEIAPCTHMQNRECGCVEGYYKFVVNEITMSCKPCRTCKDGEMETSPCNGEKDRKCACKHNYYRMPTGTCAHCANCTSTCDVLCPSDPLTHPLPGPTIQMTIMLCLCAVIVFLGILTLYKGVKRWRKRIQSQYSQSPVSCDPEQQGGERETESKEDEGKLLTDQQIPVLPDCIPKEIKAHEFIYSVLDIVPVSRFKELVRRLKVSEQAIDRAERDNRAFADAQYQMLMIWIESGSGGGKNMLPRQHLQECVDRLKDMNLTACAESLEDKYA